VSLFANPIFGALSDATTSRFGRRRPWVLVGGIGGAGAMWVLSQAHSVAMLTLGWALAQLTLNILLAALMAMVPDRVPVTQRGFVSALAGLSQLVGQLGGLGIVVVITGGFGAKYGAIAAVLVVTALLLAVGVPDQPLPAREAPRLSLKRLALSLWVNPVRYPDFGWAWITRFLVMLGYAVGLTFLYLFLHDAVKYEELFPGEKTEDGQLILTAIAGVGVVLTMFAGGVISDRTGRRKVFVMASTAVIASGLLVLAFSQTWPAAQVAAALIGLGYGVYLSVDVALITEVLPNPEDRGKDLGVINIANTLPQLLAPPLCALFVKHLGGYPVMFLAATMLTLLGAVLVQPIRGVR
jgi:MFS family permease